MTETITILNKVLVKEYYRLNAGFFLVIGTLAFGFMSGVEHQALAQFFVSSPVVMLIPIIIWIIYTVKIINFNNEQLKRAENLVLFEISLLVYQEKIICLLIALTSQFMPALLYGLFLIFMAVKFGQWIAVTQIAAALILLLILITVLLFVHLNHPNQERKITPIKKFIDNRFTKPIVQFYIGWLVRREPALLVGTKVFGGLLIFAVSQLYHSEAYDWRLLAMAVTLAFSGNFMIISQLHRFENLDFVLIRNLPIALFKRLAINTIVSCILYIPEIIVLLKYFPETLPIYQFFFLTIFGLSISFIFYGFLFFHSVHPEGFTYLIFASIILWVVMILFAIPLLLLTAGNFMTGLVLIKKNYYSFEYNVGDDIQLEQ